MYITLSVPWTNPADQVRHVPDTKLDLDPEVAKQLIRDGWARKAEADPVPNGQDPDPSLVPPPRTGKGSGTEAWRAYAEGKVALPDDASREDIIAALGAVGVPTERAPQPAQTTDSPDQGNNEKE